MICWSKCDFKDIFELAYWHKTQCIFVLTEVMVKETQDMSHMGSRKEVLKQNHSVCVYGMVIRSTYYGCPQIKYFWNKFHFLYNAYLWNSIVIPYCFKRLLTCLCRTTMGGFSFQAELLFLVWWFIAPWAFYMSICIFSNTIPCIPI